MHLSSSHHKCNIPFHSDRNSHILNHKHKNCYSNNYNYNNIINGHHHLLLLLLLHTHHHTLLYPSHTNLISTIPYGVCFLFQVHSYTWTNITPHSSWPIGLPITSHNANQFRFRTGIRVRIKNRSTKVRWLNSIHPVHDDLEPPPGRHPAPPPTESSGPGSVPQASPRSSPNPLANLSPRPIAPRLASPVELRRITRQVQQYGKDHDWPAALDLFYTVTNPDVVLCNVVISVCARERQCEHAFRVWEWMIGTSTGARNQINDEDDIEWQTEHNNNGVILDRVTSQPELHENSNDNLYSTSSPVVLPTLVTYNSLLDACAKVGDFDRALRLLEQIKTSSYHHHIAPNTISYNSCIAACANAAKILFTKFKLNHKPLIDRIHNYITLQSQSDHHINIQDDPHLVQWLRPYKTAFGLLQEMKTQPANQPDIITYNTLIDLCGHYGLIQQAMLLLDELTHNNTAIIPNTATYNSCIKACEKVGDLRHALALLKQMAPPTKSSSYQNSNQHYTSHKSTMFRDLISYNTCMQVAVMANHSQIALSLLESLKSSQVLTPDLFSYNTCINACAKTGAWKEALQLLAEMKDSFGLQPDIFTFNAVMSACEKAGKWDVACTILDSLSSNRESSSTWIPTSITHITPDINLYNICLRACIRAGNFERAHQIYQTIRNTPGIAPDLYTYNCLLSKLEQTGDLDQAFKILQDIRNDGLKPDIVSFTSCINACDKLGNWDKAFDILEMIKDSDCELNTVAYNACIKVCANHGQLERALALFHEMTESPWVQPDIITYNTCLLAFQKAANFQDAKRFFQDMKSCPIPPDVTTYNIMINACNSLQAKQSTQEPFRTALSYLDQMIQSGIRPDNISFSSCIMACARERRWQEAVNLLSVMKRLDIVPNVVTYSACIHACEKGFNWKMAIKLLNQMKEEHVEPNIFSYNACISACEKGNQPEQALMILRELNAKRLNSGSSAESNHLFSDANIKFQSKILKADIVSYCGCMLSCTKSGRWREAVDLYLDAVQNNIEMNMYFWRLAVIACQNIGEDNLRSKLIKEGRKREWI